MDEAFGDSIDVVAAVLALFRDTVHEGIIRADVIGADFPFLRVIGNFTKEDCDGIVGRDLELLEFNPGGPIEDSMVGGSSVQSGRSLSGQGPSKGTLGLDDRWTPPDVESIQFVDFQCNGSADGVWISSVQAVEFGIGVAELCGIEGAGGGPERGLVVGERSQSWNERYNQTPQAAIQSAYPCSYRRAVLRE